jgi:hypothetical protein
MSALIRTSLVPPASLLTITVIVRPDEKAPARKSHQ